jgi:NADP-dependent 3-hydroxy acid dehydrogenase YdfG
MPGIEGKVIAITGASSGIGEATARLLTECGAKVTLVQFQRTLFG